jgi:hypothetical protein
MSQSASQQIARCYAKIANSEAFSFSILGCTFPWLTQLKWLGLVSAEWHPIIAAILLAQNYIPMLHWMGDLSSMSLAWGLKVGG